MNKLGTSHVLMPPPNRDNIPSYLGHPNFLTAMDSLWAYEHWVNNIVMPIAFQWIAEHYQKVYYHSPDEIPEELKDDVGVVIARAFGLVRQTEAYAKSLKKTEEFRRIKPDSPDIAILNPVWTRITDSIRQATMDSFEREEQFLDDTIFPDE